MTLKKVNNWMPGSGSEARVDAGLIFGNNIAPRANPPDVRINSLLLICMFFKDFPGLLGAVAVKQLYRIFSLCTKYTMIDYLGVSTNDPPKVYAIIQYSIPFIVADLVHHVICANP